MNDLILSIIWVLFDVNLSKILLNEASDYDLLLALSTFLAIA